METIRMCIKLVFHSLVLVLFGISSLACGLEVGFGKVEITPDLNRDRPVWIAGYGKGRRATGIHDPLYARAVVLKDGARSVALVSVDLIGFMYPNTKAVRRKLDGFAYVLVASTHNHEGPDTIGLWGPSAFTSGVNSSDLARVESKIVEAVKQAKSSLFEVEARYGSASDPALLHDARLPEIKDATLRMVEFRRPGPAAPAGLIVQWNGHPESLGSKNTLITADFPHASIAALERRHGCPVVYFSGAVGGLMTNPREIGSADGTRLAEGTFAFAQAYGERVADLADSALALSRPIALTPFMISAKPIAVPMTNPVYRLGRQAGVLEREAFAWTGDPGRLGPPISERWASGDLAMETEVAYLRLGKLHLAAIPGELYPELVSGSFQEPVEPAADFPEARREPAILATLPGPEVLVIGLANDELGYIIPKRQWDEVAPFAYGRSSPQYGEVNSIGPETAPILLNALRNLVNEAD